MDSQRDHLENPDPNFSPLIPEPTPKRRTPLILRLCGFLVFAFFVAFYIWVFALSGSQAAVPIGVIVLGLVALRIFKREPSTPNPELPETLPTREEALDRGVRNTLLRYAGGVVVAIVIIVLLLWILISAVHWFWDHSLW
jgi:hypothetical protein